MVKKKTVKADVNGNTKKKTEEEQQSQAKPAAEAESAEIESSQAGTPESETAPSNVNGSDEAGNGNVASTTDETKQEAPAETPANVAATLKDTDLDLSVEFEANISLSSPVVEETKLEAKVAAPDENVTAVTTAAEEVTLELKPKPMDDDVTAATLTVAGIAPAAEKQADAAIVQEKASTKTPSTAEPTAAKAAQTPAPEKAQEIQPQEPKKVEEKLAPTAGGSEPAAEPYHDLPWVKPKAAKPCEGQIMTVAGIAPPSAKVDATKAPTAATAQGQTKTAAGITADAKPAKKDVKKPAETPKSSGETNVGADKKPKAEQKIETKAPAAAEPEKPREVRKRPPQPPLKRQVKAIPDEFFDNLFYFSGMGTVVGSALSKGVYVPKRHTSTALEVEVIEQYEAQRDDAIARSVRVVKRARNEAVDLAEELRKLQALLAGLPTFGGGETTQTSSRMPPLPTAVAAPRRIDIPALDMIAKKVESVAKDIPAPPPQLAAKFQPPPPAPKPAAPAPQPAASAKSAFVPVRAPAESRVPPITNGGVSDVGVFKGMVDSKPPHQSWQDRYAKKPVADQQPPKPFGSATGGGEIPSGLKPWELSRLRGLEARGFEFSHEKTQSGADHSDAFYHGGSHMTDSEPPQRQAAGARDDDIASYAPFLVSSRSLKHDITDQLQHDKRPAMMTSPRHVMASPRNVLASPRNVMASPRNLLTSPAPQMLASPVSSSGLPYCDL